MFNIAPTQAGLFYQINNLDLQCKEEWIFHAHILDLLDERSPARAYIEYILEKYPTAKFSRQTYVVEEGYFQEPCGLRVVFEDKDHAEQYAEELNSKYYQD